MPAIRVVMPLTAAAALVACASEGSSVEVASQATGSPYFSLSRAGVYRAGSGIELVGRVCRRGRAALLSPQRVRLEHIVAGGQTAEVAHAAVPPIYRRADQACASYATRTMWAIGDGDTIRACFERGRPCPAAAETKAVVPLPATAAPPPASP